MLNKRAIVFILTSFTISIQGFCQTNFVPNPSFETKSQCPVSLAELQYSIGWLQAKGTCDYFDSCANSSSFPFYYFGTPRNFAGSQYPRSGSAYAGLITYDKQVPGYREYLTIQLTNSLVIGTKYFVSAFISKADSIALGNHTGGSTNKFGYKFSTIKKTEASTCAPQTDNFAHIYSSTIITDKNNWTVIKGSFIADSSYSYIIIGNFFDDSNTDTLDSNKQAYYYLDDVCVSSDSNNCAGFVGIEELEVNDQFKIFPNPARNYIYINSEKKEILEFIILDMVGDELINGNFIGSTEIELDNFYNGIYFLKVKDGRNVMFKKFIIAR